VAFYVIARRDALVSAGETGLLGRGNLFVVVLDCFAPAATLGSIAASLSQ
jgi:hypothetical protein